MARETLIQTTRPGMIVALVILNAASALFGLLMAFFLLSSGFPPLQATGTVLTTVSIFSVIFAVGIWMLRRWARLLMLGLSIVNVPFSLFGILASGGRDPGTYLTLVTAIFSLYVLFQSPIKRLFT